MDTRRDHRRHLRRLCGLVVCAISGPTAVGCASTATPTAPRYTEWWWQGLKRPQKRRRSRNGRSAMNINSHPRLVFLVIIGLPTNATGLTDQGGHMIPVEQPQLTIGAILGA